MVLVGMAGEYVTALDDNLRFHSMHNAQHITMFAFFLFPVIFDLLHFYRVPGKYTLISLISFIVKSYSPPPKGIPPNMDLVAGAVAFAVEGVLFFWHLHGRTNMDVQVRSSCCIDKTSFTDKQARLFGASPSPRLFVYV